MLLFFPLFFQRTIVSFRRSSQLIEVGLQKTQTLIQILKQVNNEKYVPQLPFDGSFLFLFLFNFTLYINPKTTSFVSQQPTLVFILCDKKKKKKKHLFFCNLFQGFHGCIQQQQAAEAKEVIVGLVSLFVVRRVQGSRQQEEAGRGRCDGRHTKSVAERQRQGQALGG